MDGRFRTRSPGATRYRGLLSVSKIVAMTQFPIRRIFDPVLQLAIYAERYFVRQNASGKKASQEFGLMMNITSDFGRVRDFSDGEAAHVVRRGRLTRWDGHWRCFRRPELLSTPLSKNQCTVYFSANDELLNAQNWNICSLS